MSIVYTAALKNTRLDSVKTAIDVGAGLGKIRIGTVGMAATLVEINFADPSAPAASGGVLTFTMPKSGVASAAGTAAAAEIYDGSATPVLVASGLTVGTTGTDITLDSVTIASGQTVTINTATITHG